MARYAEPATVVMPALRPGAAPAVSLRGRGSPRPGPPAPPPAPPVPRRWRWFSPVLALLAVALLPVAAATTDLDALDGWGLAKVLGPAAWARWAARWARASPSCGPRAPRPDAGDGDRGARAVQHRHAVGRGAGGPVHHRRTSSPGSSTRSPATASPARHRRPLLLAGVLRPVGVVPRRRGRGRPRRRPALVPAGGRAGVGDRGVRAGPLDARRHPRTLGRGVAVRRAELDRAGLLLAAGDRHRPDAHGADLRAGPAGDPPDRRRGRAGLAAAPGRAAAAAAAPLDRRGDDAAEPADAAAAAAAAHLLLRGVVPARSGARAPAHPVRDHRSAGAAGRGRPVPRPGARARRDPRRGGVHHHRCPRLLEEPDRAAARQRRRRQRPGGGHRWPGWPATSGRSA